MAVKKAGRSSAAEGRTSTPKTLSSNPLAGQGEEQFVCLSHSINQYFMFTSVHTKAVILDNKQTNKHTKTTTTTTTTTNSIFYSPANTEVDFRVQPALE